MIEVGVHEIRSNLAELINRVAYGGERVVLQRRSKPVAAVVSMEDLELLTAMEEQSRRKSRLESPQGKGRNYPEQKLQEPDGK